MQIKIEKKISDGKWYLTVDGKTDTKYGSLFIWRKILLFTK